MSKLCSKCKNIATSKLYFCPLSKGDGKVLIVSDDESWQFYYCKSNAEKSSNWFSLCQECTDDFHQDDAMHLGSAFVDERCKENTPENIVPLVLDEIKNLPDTRREEISRRMTLDEEYKKMSEAVYSHESTDYNLTIERPKGSITSKDSSKQTFIEDKVSTTDIPKESEEKYNGTSAKVVDKDYTLNLTPFSRRDFHMCICDGDYTALRDIL